MTTTEENYINDRPVTINAEKLNQSSIVKICQRLFSMFSSEGVDSSADAYTYLVDMPEQETYEETQTTACGMNNMCGCLPCLFCTNKTGKANSDSYEEIHQVHTEEFRSNGAALAYSHEELAHEVDMLEHGTYEHPQATTCGMGNICRCVSCLFGINETDSTCSNEELAHEVDMLEHMEPMSTPPDKHMWNERHM